MGGRVVRIGRAQRARFPRSVPPPELTHTQTHPHPKPTRPLPRTLPTHVQIHMPALTPDSTHPPNPPEMPPDLPSEWLQIDPPSPPPGTRPHPPNPPEIPPDLPSEWRSPDVLPIPRLMPKWEHLHSLYERSEAERLRQSSEESTQGRGGQGRGGAGRQGGVGQGGGFWIGVGVSQLSVAVVLFGRRRLRRRDSGRGGGRGGGGFCRESRTCSC